MQQTDLVYSLCLHDTRMTGLPEHKPCLLEDPNGRVCGLSRGCLTRYPLRCSSRLFNRRAYVVFAAFATLQYPASKCVLIRDPRYERVSSMQ